MALALASVAIGALAPLAASANATPGHYIVVLRDSVADPAEVANEHAKKHGAQPSQLYRYALKGYAAKVPDSKLQVLRADPRVESVEADRELRAPTPPPPPPEQPAQVLTLAVDRIDGDLSSTRSGDGQGSVPVNVAVLDTGIDVDHPDLNVAGGVDCTAGKGFDDPEGHGTFVAGLIGAKDNAIGVVGVAPGAPLWAVRVVNKHGQAASSKVICGIDWVTSTRLDSNPGNDIAVANLSWGGKLHGGESCGSTQPKPHALRLATCHSIAAGVTYVVAAGNEAADLAPLEPATWDDVLTMTAIAETDGQPGGVGPPFPPECGAPQDADETPATFANFATQAADQAHTLAAPGVCLLSTFPDKQYALWSGTSFSTPLAAGTVALCVTNQCIGLTPQQIVQKIVADARAYNEANPGYGFQGDPLRPIGGKYYGYLIRAGLY